MEHVNLRSGVLRPADRQLLGQTGLYHLHEVHGTRIQAMLSLDESVLRREQLPNVTFYLLGSYEGLVSAAGQSAAALAWAARDRYMPRKPAKAPS